MRIAVLFDGAGLARLGLEQAGHECVGYEISIWKHYLSTFVGSGNSVLADVRKVDLQGFDAIWASPPCQLRSNARNRTTAPSSKFTQKDLTQWSLGLKRLPLKALWVEQVVAREGDNQWGTLWNAAQFVRKPLQNRNRIVGGFYPLPKVYRGYKKVFPDVCPTITATEYKGCASDPRRASRFYGRKLTMEECAYHQGFKIPEQWYEVPKGFRSIYGTPSRWRENLYEGIGNGVPVYMAYQFGLALRDL